MKNNLPRVLMVLAGLLLLLLFILPLWQITLIAPQYREGITMHIYIYKISGSTPSTLQNINILNHYIGMKEIVPESIPELKFLPVIILCFVALAFIAAWKDEYHVYLGWILLFTIGCLLGIYDFYLWEYDYGHNLSPTAPIKIEGQAYQPPLIGTKVLLNFLAKSYPHTGGIAATISLIFGYIAVIIKHRSVEVTSD